MSSGFKNASCRGFNRQNVETGSIQRSPIWGIAGLFICCLKISYEMAGSYSDVVKCLWLGSQLFHHADLMERQGVWRQRQIDKDRRSVYSLTSQGGSVSRSWLKLNEDVFCSSEAERLTHMISNHFQSTAAHAKLQHTQTYGWCLNPSPQLLTDKIYMRAYWFGRLMTWALWRELSVVAPS